MSNDADFAAAFLAEAHIEFSDCHKKIRHCLGQLSDEQTWWRADEGLNSIGNLVLHLSGNIGQRLGSLVGGDPDRRNRDQEFAERRKIPTSELTAQFDAAIHRAQEVLAGLSAAQLRETRRYRLLKGEVEGTVLVVIMQTLSHLAGHTQEIIALARLQLRDGYRFLQTPAKP